MVHNDNPENKLLKNTCSLQYTGPIVSMGTLNVSMIHLSAIENMSVSRSAIANAVRKTVYDDFLQCLLETVTIDRIFPTIPTNRNIGMIMVLKKFTSMISNYVSFTTCIIGRSTADKRQTKTFSNNQRNASFACKRAPFRLLVTSFQLRVGQLH